MSDTRLRSLVKALTWRAIGITVLGTVSWLYTGSVDKTTLITVTFHTIQIILYYIHERLWNRIRWGRLTS